MIPRDFIIEWRKEAPWPLDSQVEQDLVISRAMVDICNVPELREALAFRGGTALYKLYLRPAARYSEDIDLVQVRPEPIGNTLDAIRAVLDPWLGEPRRAFKEGLVTLLYRFQSEDVPPKVLRLKIEINSREHFAELGHMTIPFRIDSRWFSGKAEVTTFSLNELLGTKLRALYQRKKGRDLFDLWHALDRSEVAPEHVLTCFTRYLRARGHEVTRAQFEQNLAGKRIDRRFTADIGTLLRPGQAWDLNAAMDVVLRKLISRLPGEPWQGAESE